MEAQSFTAVINVTMMSDLTETDYGILTLALSKCQLLNDLLGSKGKFKLCVVTKEHLAEASRGGHSLMALPFRFPKMDDKEVSELMQKLQDRQSIAWLKGQKSKGDL